MHDSSDDRLRQLSETFRAFAEATTDPAGLVDIVVRKLTELLGDACLVALVDANGAWQQPCAAFTPDADAMAVLQAALAERIATGGVGHAASVGEPVLIPSIDPEELARRAEPAFADAVRRLGVHSVIAVPLRARGQSLGLLSVLRYRPTSAPFGPLDRTLAVTACDHAALAIANAQLLESRQRELAEREKFAALVENSADLIGMADFDGRIVFVNAAGRRLMGIPLDRDVTRDTLADYHSPDGLAAVMGDRERAPLVRDIPVRHQITGELIPTQGSSFLVRSADGTPLCFGTVRRDLRARMQLEAELRQAQKMEALGRLAGGVAHDFNNLLTVIMSYTALLQQTLPSGDRSAQGVAQIDRAAHRAAELTHQLLAFSRRQVLEPKPLDLGATVRAMAPMIRRLVGEDIELHIATAPAAGTVMADAGRLEQVVMNLVVNARDAMARGGRLAIETATAIVDGRAHQRLSIADTGAGIPEPIRAQVFDPFFTTKEHGKGTGLGLSTVMGIVEQSGGRVTVESEVGRGSTFHVLLPLRDDPPEPPPPAVPPLARLDGAHRVLVVEDEAAVRRLIREVLSGAGYDVLDATDGAHALAVVAGQTRGIDLLLTDVVMPRLGGRELARRFAELHPAAHILYMTGYSDDRLDHHGPLDPEQLIAKPLTPDALLRRVRALLV